MRPISSSASIRIDATRLAAHPLSKERIAVYNSGLVPIERYRRDAGFIAAAAPESLRIDLGWGAEWMPWTREVVEMVDGRPRYDFAETDALADLITAAGVRPYWSYCYVPTAAREPGADWRSMARDDTVWVDTVAAYVAGMAERGVSVGYHEVYNEPDLRDERTGDATFYTGCLEDYLDLYRATSRAIRAADPHARVGGPALALAAINAEWLDAFCRAVVAEDLPLDFVSFHHYGHFGLEGTLRIVREVLAGHPRLRHVELHLNEYNAFSIDYPRGGLQDTHQLASTFAAELPRLLSHRELTRTHWAQFLDSGQGNFSGMVDIDGVAKPVHAVYEFYQRMPIDRVPCEVDGPPGVGAIASADRTTQAAIVWNRHFADVTVALDLRARDGAVPLQVVLIDADGVHPAAELPRPDGRAEITLPTGAVALVSSGERPPSRAGRCCWGIPVSTPGTGWSDLDEAGATFRFGAEPTGWTVHGVDLLDDLSIRDWEVEVKDASGAPASATVVLIDDSGTRLLAGEPVTRELPELPDPPRPRESSRLFVAACAPVPAFVTVAPAAVAGR
jgi:hypothetical protein